MSFPKAKRPFCSDPYGKSFIEKVKVLLGFKAKGGDVMEGDGGYHLREEAAPYTALFRVEKDDIGLENTYSWETNSE